MINYKELMKLKPFSYGTHVNALGQTIEFYEHPTQGDSVPIICVCHDLEMAASSSFYEIADMKSEHREYEPIFRNGNLYMGDYIIYIYTI